MFISAAIYPNRLEEKVETLLSLKEESNVSTAFYLPDNSLFATGYERLVYVDLEELEEKKVGDYEM